MLADSFHMEKIEIRYIFNVSSGTFFLYIPISLKTIISNISVYYIKLKNVQVGNDQENAKSERNSHSKNRGGKNLN